MERELWTLRNVFLPQLLFFLCFLLLCFLLQLLYLAPQLPAEVAIRLCHTWIMYVVVELIKKL